MSSKSFKVIWHKLFRLRNEKPVDTLLNTLDHHIWEVVDGTIVTNGYAEFGIKIIICLIKQLV